jgi:hypothetical protein
VAYGSQTSPQRPGAANGGNAVFAYAGVTAPAAQLLGLLAEELRDEGAGAHALELALVTTTISRMSRGEMPTPIQPKAASVWEEVV